MKSDSTKHHAGFELSSLFFVVAVCAILAALGTSVAVGLQDDSFTVGNVIVASQSVGLLGGVLGVFVGLYHFRPLRGFLVGMMTGYLTGSCVGPLLLTSDYERLVTVCLLGAIGLLAFAGCVRVMHSSR